MHTRTRYAMTAVVAWLLATPSAMPAQQAADGGIWLRAGRAELEARLRQLEQMARSGAADGRQLSGAHATAAAIRARLAEGDFSIGDRIAISIESAVDTPRSAEQQLSDTFTVGAGKELVLPVIGRVSLRGVLRSELEAHLGREIGRFLRDPLLHASPVVRLSVQGGVARPGYYSLPSGAVLSDALMAAGGPMPDARIGKLRIEREGKAIWEGNRLQQAIAAGRTIEEVGLRAGDQFVVPRRGAGAEGKVRIIAIALSIPAALFTITRAF